MKSACAGIGLSYRSKSAIARTQQAPPTKITVLTSASGKRATKRFTPNGVEGYAREGLWLWQQVEIFTFDDLARLLAKIERDPASLIVQGIVAPLWRDKEIIPRTKSKGEPSLIDEGSRVIHFDIDDLPFPLGTGWHDPEGVARAVWEDVIATHIPAFAGVSFWWQASSSAGTPGKEHLAKLHIWAMLDQPIDEDQRKALLKLAEADHCLASINQPNYVATPIFEGVPDPLAGVVRSGVVIQQQDHAAVDQIDFPQKEIRKAKARKSKAAQGAIVTPEGLDHATTDEGRDLLSRACAQISALLSGGRNTQINKTAFTIGGHVAGGSIAYAEAHSALLSAGAASGHDRYADAVENGLRDGLQRPITDTPSAKPDTPTDTPSATPQPIDPFKPSPDGDRDAAIAAHPATINAWADQNITILLATKAVAAAYAEIDHPDPDDPQYAEKLKAVRKAQRAIRKQVRSQFNLDYLPASKITDKTPITRVMLSGAQGVGKTRAVVGADGKHGILHRAKGLISILFEPDHGMAAQARRDYDDNAPEGAPPSIVLRGRGSPDPDQAEVTMCRLPDIAGRLAARGVSVPKALCEYCPFSDECGYLKQKAEIEHLAAEPEGVAIFAPHDYAFLSLPGGVEADLAIFDERPRDMGVRPRVGVSFDELGETLKFDRPLRPQSATQSAGDAADAQEANLQYIRPLSIALRNAGQDHPGRLLGAIRDQGFNAEHVASAIDGLSHFQDRETAHAMQSVMTGWRFSKNDGTPFNLESRLEAELEGRDFKIARLLSVVFEALFVEIDKKRDDAIAISVGPVARGDNVSRGIMTVGLKQHRLRQAPFLHLDGTGNHIMAQALFGEMDIEHHAVERSPAERGDQITQVVGNEFHNAGLIGGHKKGGVFQPYDGKWKTHYDTQRSDIQKIIKNHPGALVVANKGVIEALKLSDDRALKPKGYGARSAHFGAIRGRNDWEKINTVFVIGREQPSPLAIEAIARAYAAHDDASFESLGEKNYPKAQRGIRKRDGSGHPVNVAFHPNDWADHVLRQIRDAEIEQAVDRIRPIFKDSPVKIVLLSQVAVDLTVDQVLSWAEFKQGGTRIERALAEARVVPLSSREAIRMLPEIWGSKKTADRDLREFEKVGHSLNRESYLENGPLFSGVIATYRLDKKSAREHRALIAAHPDDAREVLKAIAGPLRDFEVIDVLEPDQPTVDAADAREERIAICMIDGGLSLDQAIKVADGIEIREPTPERPPDQVPKLIKVASVHHRKRRTG